MCLGIPKKNMLPVNLIRQILIFICCSRCLRFGEQAFVFLGLSFRQILTLVSFTIHRSFARRILTWLGTVFKKPVEVIYLFSKNL